MTTNNAEFHLSIGVKSIEESVHFFVDILKGSIAHRDPSGYVNINLYGCELTLKPSDDVDLPSDPHFHFGVNFDMPEFDKLAASIMASGYDHIVMAPKIVDPGTPIERKKMYLKCPSGYLIELKGYRAKK
jgi:extradiol dioxygenase family protein